MSNMTYMITTRCTMLPPNATHIANGKTLRWEWFYRKYRGTVHSRLANYRLTSRDLDLETSPPPRSRDKGHLDSCDCGQDCLPKWGI